MTQQLDLELDYHNKSLGRNYPSFTHHFEPLVRSIEATDPDYDLRQTDIVTNASNLRKMFMILLNQQSEYERYDLTWRNNILFLSKWTSDPSLNSSLGHGSGFEQATCIYDDLEDELLKSSASHHRVIQYRFGGLQLVVQSEVDAYHCDCHCPGNFDLALPETLSALTVDEVAQHRRRSSAVSAASSGASSNNLSVLSSDLSVTSLDCHCDSTRETTPASPPPSPCRSISMNDPETPFSGVLSASGNLIYSNSSPNLRVLRLGREIPARCLVEVKTHKVRNKPLFNAEAQLYFSQLSKLYIAKNDNGSFLPTVPSVSEDNKSNNPVEEKTEDIRLWVEAEQNQKTLQKVVALLKRLKDLAKQFEKEKGIRTITLLMRNDGMGEERGVNMKLYERTEECGVGGCLPEDYLDAAGWPGGKEEMGDEGLEDEAAKEEALKDEDLKDGGLQDN